MKLCALVLAGSLAAHLSAREPARQANGRQDRGAGTPTLGNRAASPATMVAENLYVIQGQSGRTVLFVGATAVVLVDPRTPENGQPLRDVVRSITDKPVTHVIRTHAHVFDASSGIIGSHAGGDASSQFGGEVETIAHERTVEAMKKAGVGGWLPLPYTTKMTMLKGRDAIDLYHFGPAHTVGDTFVVFRRLGVMYAGDVFVPREVPLIDTANGGSGIAYPDTLDKAAKGIRGVKVVIAGRGQAPGVETWKEFVDYREFNRLLLASAYAAMKMNQSATQAARDLKLPARFMAYRQSTSYGGGPEVHLDGLMNEVKAVPPRPSSPGSKWRMRLGCLLVECG